MDQPIVLHQFELSPYCDKVRRVLAFKRKPYETREVPPTETLTRLRRLSPVGKVPVLEHGATIVNDSSAIARYLDAQFPDPPLFPDGKRERALCHFLEDWADESLYFFEVWLRFGLRGNADEWSRRTSESEPPGLLRRATERAFPTVMRNVLRAQGLGRWPAEKVMAELERHVQMLSDYLDDDDWLVGERLTIADIAAFSQLSCASETGEGAAVTATHENILRWMERVNASTAPVM